MERIPEPELMDDAEQAAAYAGADFELAHSRFIDLFRETFPNEPINGEVLDLGCGPADITVRFARAYPQCTLYGMDGAEAMLEHGHRRVNREGLGERISLIRGYLPGAPLPAAAYAAVISNSLLHHLRDPAVLWETVKHCARSGAPLYVMDLLRPADRGEAESRVEEYAGDESPVLRHDFFNSLLAAYRLEEVADQLRAAGLSHLKIEAVSDIHLLVSGRMS